MSRPIATLLNLSSPPIAIAFVQSPPEGVRHVGDSEPASCGYWRRAGEVQVLYTTAADHKRCPIGAHTHNVTLEEPERHALMALLEAMASARQLMLLAEAAQSAGVSGAGPAMGRPTQAVLPEAIERQLAVIVAANDALEHVHRERAAVAE